MRDAYSEIGLCSSCCTYSLAAAILFAFAHRDAWLFYLGGALLLLVACAFSNPLLTTSLQPVTYIQPQFLLPYLFWAFAMRFPTARPFERFYKAAKVCSRVCLVVGVLCGRSSLRGFLSIDPRTVFSRASARNFEIAVQNIGWFFWRSNFQHSLSFFTERKWRPCLSGGEFVSSPQACSLVLYR